MKKDKHFLKHHWYWLFTLFSLLLDWVLLNLSFLIAIYLRADSLVPFKDYTKPLVFFNAMFFVFGLGLGVYRSCCHVSLKELSFLYKKLAVYLVLSTMAFLYMIKKGQFYSRAIIIITFIIFYVLLEITHSLLQKLQGKLLEKSSLGLNTIIIGTDKWSFKFYRQISRQLGGIYRLTGFVQGREEEPSQPPSNKGNKDESPGYIDKPGDRANRDYLDSGVLEKMKALIIGPLSHFAEIAEKYGPDIVFITSTSMDISQYEAVYETCKKNHIRLKMVSPGVGRILENSRLRDVPGVSLVVENWRGKYHRTNAIFKRIFDLLFILLITPLALPLGLLVALLVKVTSPGPVFFKQLRTLYEGGPEFEFYKFRSMYRDADSRKKELVAENESSGALFKIKKDPRITPFGRFIRKLSLDELPQLINVLKGQMAIVGPRPLPVADFDWLKGDSKNGTNSTDEPGKPVNLSWHKQRGGAKPGMTGLWQISGRSEISFEEMLYLDLYYIEHQSVFFDLEILFETVPAVLFGRGAY